MVDYRINTNLFKEIQNPLIRIYSHSNLLHILNDLKKAEKEGKLLSLYEKYMLNDDKINYSTNLVIPFADNFSIQIKRLKRVSNY